MKRRITPILALGVLALPLSARAQSDGPDPAAEGATPAIGLLPDAPAATLGMKLERTIFKVDVLTLTIRVDRETAAEIAEVVAGHERVRPELADSIAALAIRPEEAIVEIEFLRTIGLDQFLDGASDDIEEAVEAGWVEPGTAAMLADSLPVWFGFLETREIQDGDRLSYHVRGDSLRTVFRGQAEDRVLLDQTDVGRQSVLGLLGAYFAPGSTFREDLIESLWEGWLPDGR